MILEPLAVIREIGALFVRLLTLVGWIGALAVLFVLVKGWRLRTKKRAAVKKIEWKHLELRMPKDNARSPKAMEQVFAGLHAIYAGEKALVQEWFSFEMLGLQSGIRFFIRTPKPHRNLVEAALFAQYPDIEIGEAPDYVKRFGAKWGDDENEAYDLAGFDLALARDPHFPIRTYPSFMESRRVEEEHVDPIGIFAEAMSNLKADEQVWIQLLARPTGDAWKRKGEEAILKFYGRKPEEKKEEKSGVRVVYDELFSLIKNIFRALAFQSPVWPEEKKDEKPAARVDITEAERDLAKAIHGKISKLGFECALRCLYLDTKGVEFTRSNVTAIAGAFKQFDSPTHNSFKPISSTAIPSGAKWFQERKIHEKKEELFGKYAGRGFPDLDTGMKRPVLNTEELATLFHPPVAEVASSSGLRAVELKKGMPPSNLPFIVEEARGAKQPSG
ncbi:MAG: hypothetical protein HY536_01115 [Candidatus Colwellbacteria bacterium]|nr:hypothetical protein [Candidatus Colwellbacteria bacterium]